MLAAPWRRLAGLNGRNCREPRELSNKPAEAHGTLPLQSVHTHTGATQLPFRALVTPKCRTSARTRIAAPEVSCMQTVRRTGAPVVTENNDPTRFRQPQTEHTSSASPRLFPAPLLSSRMPFSRCKHSSAGSWPQLSLSLSLSLERLKERGRERESAPVTGRHCSDGWSSDWLGQKSGRGVAHGACLAVVGPAPAAATICMCIWPFARCRCLRTPGRRRDLGAREAG